ncbi:MAG: hypothetical protein ABWY00_03290 [Dongiaceae bacterium]
MDLSSTVGIAATYEAARVTGVQQATNSASAQEAQRDTTKRAQELDLKRKDVVSGTADDQNAGGTKEKRLDIRV